MHSVAFTLTLALLLSACRNSEPAPAAPGASAEQQAHNAATMHEGHDHADPAAPASGAEAAPYSCPMHPEVSQAGPGRCPKCGMDLVREEKK